MNLATAQSTTRAREVGIRKIVGSTRGSLIRQFLFESLVMSLISLVLAVVLIQLILPMFNQLIRKQLDLQHLLDPFNIFLFLGIGIFVGLFGLSAYMATQRTKEIGIRKVLGSTGSKIVVLLSKDFSRLVLFAGLAALVVAQVTVSFQAIKAANAHPADAVRSE